MPDPVPARKPGPPRKWRIGLWAPYAAVLLALIGWSVAWLFLRAQVAGALDRQAADLRASGYQAEWSARRITGYPFRIEVELDDPRWTDPSGWGLAAPKLKGVAAAYKLDHWVIVADDGLTLSRPARGDVAIKAWVLRASIADARRAPRFDFEGRKLTFTPAPGARPFSFTAADLAEFHWRPAEGDKALLFWRMDGAQTNRSGLFARIAPLAPLSFSVAGELSNRSRLTGRDWPAAVRHWTDQGGSAKIGQLTASVGDVSLDAQGGPLTVGYDGRLRGDLSLTLRQGAQALAALAGADAIAPSAAASAAGLAQDHGGQLTLSFQAGETTIGPVRVAPAPRVY